MGISKSPDIATEKMHSVLDDIEGIEFYMDDIGVFSSTWPAHSSLLSTVLGRLENMGFTINPLKCEWAVQETDFLGHWLTPSGIKPWNKKADAILHLRPPTNVKQLRCLLGMVNYYCDMWPRHTHVLAPLTTLTGKHSFLWTPECQCAFDHMKALVSSDALLAFPDHTQPFDVEMDASEYQLGSVIKQHDRPVAYYSHKLNSAQRNYTTIEKELLSIIETFKEFRSILLGSTIHVHTDHKNLTHRLTDFTTQRILCWHLLLEEFNPMFLYKAGPDNVHADTLSRVPTAHTERESTTMFAQLVDCLSCYLFQVKFLSDQVVVANCRADCPLIRLPARRLWDGLVRDNVPYPQLWCNPNRKNSSSSIRCLMLRADCPSNIKHCMSTNRRILVFLHSQPTNHTNINWKIWAVMDLFAITKGNTIIRKRALVLSDYSEQSPDTHLHWLGYQLLNSSVVAYYPPLWPLDLCNH